MARLLFHHWHSGCSSMCNASNLPVIAANAVKYATCGGWRHFGCPEQQSLDSLFDATNSLPACLSVNSLLCPFLHCMLSIC